MIDIKPGDCFGSGVFGDAIVGREVDGAVVAGVGAGRSDFMIAKLEKLSVR